MRIALVVVRIIIGLLFIFSGLVKANDPLGLSYKMQEFFEVWGMSSLNDYALFFACAMNVLEIVTGVAVLLGWRMKFFSWLLLLLMIFFTFLTGYAVLSGEIKTCGCFGDCIPLTAYQSFIKDIALLVLTLFLFTFRRHIKPFLLSGTNGGIVVFTALFAIILQWYVLKHLPFVDCLPYKIGNNIPEKMKQPAGSIPDSFAIVFKYKKAGKEVQFDMDHFPDDFNDSTYQFIERKQTLVKEGTGKPAITDFNLSSISGNDTTGAILADKRYQVFLFLKDLSTARKFWEDNLPAVFKVSEEKNFPFYVVTSQAALVQAHFAEIKGIDPKQVIFLKADATMIKTAGRENPTYIILKDGTIVGKYAAADWKKAVNKLKQLK